MSGCHDATEIVYLLAYDRDAPLAERLVRRCRLARHQRSRSLLRITRHVWRTRMRLLNQCHIRSSRPAHDTVAPRGCMLSRSPATVLPRAPVAERPVALPPDRERDGAMAVIGTYAEYVGLVDSISVQTLRLAEAKAEMREWVVVTREIIAQSRVIMALACSLLGRNF